jgi:hypothetical protein
MRDIITCYIIIPRKLGNNLLRFPRHRRIFHTFTSTRNIPIFKHRWAKIAISAVFWLLFFPQNRHNNRGLPFFKAHLPEFFQKIPNAFQTRFYLENPDPQVVRQVGIRFQNLFA